MIFPIKLFLCFIYICRLVFAVGVDYLHEEKGKEFLKILNRKSARIASKLFKAQWDLETENKENAEEEFLQTTSEAIKNIKRGFENVVSNYPWWSFSDPDTKRQFKLYSEIGIFALPSEEYRKFQDIISDVEKITRDTTICDFYNKTKCNLHLYPDIKNKLTSSKNAEELLYLSSEWKKATRYELSKLLIDYVQLCNKAAVYNNYTNFREYSLREINLSNPGDNMTTLWESIKPLYYQIHAYVRRKLREVYGEKIVPRRGTIPSYLLGNIWYENWSEIASKILPFPELDNLNFTAVMINLGLTPEMIHKQAESFFVSMNFSIPSPLWFSDSSKVDEFKNVKSCHPKVFNFFNKNVRIKDCGKVSMKDFLTANGLLFKSQYVIQYSQQPFVYQKPDRGLEIALRDIIVMCSSTFSTLKKLGLYKDEINEKVRLNRLFKIALEKVVAIPFFLVQEFWRWEIYDGRRVEDTTNYLKSLREKFQGISTFTKELNFDPGGAGSAFSKFSLSHNFISYFLEFHIYDVLCNKSKTLDGFYKNFDECNLYDSEEVGRTLRSLMSLGSSKVLNEALSLTLDIKNITSESLLKYFEPLQNWLTEENKKTGEFIGWSNGDFWKLISEKRQRRKRSIDRYPLERNDDIENEDMYVSSPSREPSGFEPTKVKRSKSYPPGLKRRKKGAEGDAKKNDQKVATNKNSAVEEEKKNSEKVSEESKEWKVRRSLSRNTNRLRDSFKEPRSEGGKVRESSQIASYHSPKTKKRRIENELPDQISEKNKNLNNKGFYQKRSDKYSGNINYENIGTEGNSKNDVDEMENSARYVRRVRNKLRRRMSDAGFSHYDIWQKRDQNRQKDRYLRGAQWHSDTKKDISRLLHSFGFAVESDDKEKIKELKKKLKGDSNSDLKSNLISKESSYDNVVDLSRIKSGEGQTDADDDKGINKLWSVKSYLNENFKTYQKNPSLSKKDGTFYLAEEGKKESSYKNNQNLAALKDKILDNLDSHHSHTSIRRLNLDLPSLQALLKNADLSANEKSAFTVNNDLLDSKMMKTELNQLEGKTDLTKSSNNKMIFKYSPNSDSNMLKDKKDRDELDNIGKSPYIIILSELTPELKEQLLKEKRTMALEKEKSLLQNIASLNEEPASEKKNMASERIVILPVDVKSNQFNLPRSSHHGSQEFEGDPETDEQDEQSQAEENSPADGDSSFEGSENLYRNSQDSPSEFIISWSDKSKKAVKRRKREHKKDLDENNLKLVKLAPVKESVLAGLLGKSLDRSSLNDKNVKILIHDGLLNGDSDLSSAIYSLSSPRNQNFGSFLDSDQGQSSRDQSVSLQPESPLASISSNVLSAFSPKSYSQVGKPNLQHQDSDNDDDNIKDSAHGSNKEPKDQDLPFLLGPNLRCNSFASKKKGIKFFSDDEKKVLDDPTGRDSEISCKKLILTPCPPKNPTTCPSAVTLPSPISFPSPLPFQSDSECTKKPECNNAKNDYSETSSSSSSGSSSSSSSSSGSSNSYSNSNNKNNTSNKPSECSLVNCQFKITKAKKPHERLTIMIYDRINPPTELPEPFDALAVISEILQRIQTCSNKPNCQLTEEDPDYPVNDNSDQLKSNQNQPAELNKAKVQEMSGEMPILANDNSDDDDPEDNPQNSVDTNDEGKYQTKEKATPAIDQLTVFNKDKLKPLFIDLRKIDDLMKKRSQEEKFGSSQPTVKI